MEKMSSIIRREFKKGDDIRDAGLTAPDDVIRYKDIAYGKDSAMQMLDVYRPKDTEGNLPVIVSVHGGVRALMDCFLRDKSRLSFFTHKYSS